MFVGNMLKPVGSLTRMDRNGPNYRNGPKHVPLSILYVLYILDFFGENFCLLEGRKNIFLSASRSQFVVTRPAKILKIGQKIKFLWPK